MRANVYISSTGFCSRRMADKFISEGKVTVNGKTAVIGMDILDTDDVKVNGIPIKTKPESIYLLYHKPKGIESTTDTKKPYNIIDAIHYPERIFPIGRLDKDSTGLILLTNDGQIVNQILRSENNHEKEYLVKVDRPITQDFINHMSNGVEIYNPVQHIKQTTKPAKMKQIDSYTFSITLIQGLNLQIRRMSKALGYNVISLHRTRIMNLTIDNLPTGNYRLLTPKELLELKNLIK